MTTGYICVLISIIIPQLWAAWAKSGLVSSKEYNNSASRPQLEQLTGANQRAKWAEQNHLETLPGFIAAVIIAHLAGVEQSTIDTLAIVHVVARFAFGVCYIKDLATLRSTVWVVGFLAMIGLFVAAF